jgi:hypothetical protein
MGHLHKKNYNLFCVTSFELNEYSARIYLNKDRQSTLFAPIKYTNICCGFICFLYQERD